MRAKDLHIEMLNEEIEAFAAYMYEDYYFDGENELPIGMNDLRETTLTQTKNMTTNNSISAEYPLCNSVRMDKNDLLIDIDMLLRYLNMDSETLVQLRNCCKDRVQNRKEDRFPEPIQIDGKDFWRLSEIRRWEISCARRSQYLEDIESIFRDVKFAMNSCLTHRQERFEEAV
jgi:predicted DNA-binding transcriptional regulator AlpA